MIFLKIAATLLTSTIPVFRVNQDFLKGYSTSLELKGYESMKLKS